MHDSKTMFGMFLRVGCLRRSRISTQTSISTSLRRTTNNRQLYSSSSSSSSVNETPASFSRLNQKYHIPCLGTIKVSLDSPSTIGIAQSRGERSYQEDFFCLSSLLLNQNELNKTIKKSKNYRKFIGNQLFTKKKILQRKTSSQEKDYELEKEETHLQTLFVGVIDGHGGTESAEYLSKHFPRLIEQCSALEIPNVIRKYRAVGGYFRRFRGGFLEELGEAIYKLKSKEEKETYIMGIDERLSLGFLLADQQLMESFPKSGAVTTTILLTPLPINQNEEDTRSSSPIIYPFFNSPLLSLIVGHAGDTAALLCSAIDGKVVPLTENHHPDSRVESERLRKIGTGLITDSFGESRWGGSLANSRGLGDSSFKALGVTGEPDIVNKIIKGDEWEFLILVSDGISNVMTNQEIVDLCKGQKSPTDAAKNVVKFAETLGGRDNMTAIVVPLLKWGNLNSQDFTADRREFRERQSTGSTRQKRM